MTESAARATRPERSTYLALCHDGPEATAMRARHLEEHLLFIESNIDKVRVAGPIANSLDEEFTGSIFLIAANNEDQAREILVSDPYIRCGMYREINIYPFIPAAGHWIGGVTWDKR